MRTTNNIAACRVVLAGGVIAGALDFTYAIRFHGARGVPAIRIPQSVASGLLGASSFAGGWRTAAEGIALHFTIALCVAGVYYAASAQVLVVGA